MLSAITQFLRLIPQFSVFSIGSFLIGQQFGITPFGHPVKNKKVPEPDIGKTDIWLRDTFLIFCLLTEAV